MGKGKPRHNPDKPEHLMGGKYPYDDGTRWKECHYPWANKCDGNRYKCRKLCLQHVASLSEAKKKQFIEKYNGCFDGAPRTNCYRIKTVFD